MKQINAGFAVFLLTSLSFGTASASRANPSAFWFENRDGGLALEFVSDHGVHFEYHPRTSLNIKNAEIPRSEMVANRRDRGPKQLNAKEGRFETEHLLVSVNASSLCFEMKRKIGKYSMMICPEKSRFRQRFKIQQDQRQQDQKQQSMGDEFGITITAHDMVSAYGLGQRFRKVGSSEGQWMGELVQSSDPYGNVMKPYAGGAVGETQIPMLTALRGDGTALTIFIDSYLAQTFDLTRNPWSIRHQDTTIRGFIEDHPSPLAAREYTMRLLGTAPVPLKKLFGFWLSEYGFENWNEIDTKLSALRKDQFPIDGVFLDLQWFGGVTPASDDTPIGKLKFDEKNFPRPKQKIAELRANGIGVIPIEESYVGRNLAEHRDLESRGYLAHKCGSPTTASYLTGDVHGNTSEWWGRGGMIDWSNDGARSYWHKTKRQPLIDMGIMGHWLDLGEPEMFDKNSCYAGVNDRKTHRDVHNLFSFMWAKGVYEGYEGKNLRPFSMLRSGTAGIQRFGAGFWSGDIAGNLESLASHQNASMHLIFSGIDYYNSDIGGFHRRNTAGQKLSMKEVNENYTQWFAVSSWFDIPMRAHTLNLENDQQTSPNRVGEISSNLFNLRTRYELIPYYYSLAHAAYQTGRPIFYPMVMMHPTDSVVREMGHQRYVGPSLMVALTSKSGESQRDVYLPAGEWFDFRTQQHHSSTGRWLRHVPVREGGIFRLAAFVKAGAIIPMASRVDAKALKVRVYPSNQETSFDLIEDDGSTRDYERGQFATTRIEQRMRDQESQIVIQPTKGAYRGQQLQRSVIVQFVTQGLAPKAVRINGELFGKVREVAKNLFEVEVPNWNSREMIVIEIE